MHCIDFWRWARQARLRMHQRKTAIAGGASDRRTIAFGQAVAAGVAQIIRAAPIVADVPTGGLALLA